MTKTFKAHCSGIAAIMTQPRAVKAKEAGELSETAKKAVLQRWIEDNFDKHKEFSNKYTEKGNHCEERGITAFDHYVQKQVRQGLWKFTDPVVLSKNEKVYYGDHFVGTPDIVEPDFLADIKCPYSLENFILATADDYEEQLQGYMHLTGVHKALLVYCLLDAPEWIIEWETRTLQRKANPDMADEIAEAVRRNMTFDNVPNDKKVKIFEIEYKPELIKGYQEKVVKCQTYYNTITL